MTPASRLALGLIVLSVGCGEAGGAGEDPATTNAALTANCPANRGLALYPGPRSTTCVASRYDCDMPGGKSRYENPADNTDLWPVAKGVPVLDGRGKPIGSVTVSTTKLNFGQAKILNGKRHVYAFSVGSGDDDVSGWVPAACIGWNGKGAPAGTCSGESGSLPNGFPIVNGRKPPTKYDAVAVYELIATNPMLATVNLDELKVVCNAPAEPHRSLADYMPRQRPDGSYTINLVATLPGMDPALGGIAADTFRVAHMEGSTLVSDHVSFHRLLHVTAVPVYLFQAGTAYGALGLSSSDNAPRTVFVYGYVSYPKGDGGWARRYGWVSYFALGKP